MVDFLTGATAFASIVSLIGQYRSERSKSGQADINDFQQWLENNHQQEVINFLKKNTRAIESLESLILEDKNTLLNKLEGLDNALAAFATNVQGFAQLAEAINPESVLSEQAVSILQQFEEVGASKILEAHTLGGLSFIFVGGRGGQLQFNQEQFIEDDFTILTDLGLLRADYNSKNQITFKYTRAASLFIDKLN